MCHVRGLFPVVGLNNIVVFLLFDLIHLFVFVAAAAAAAVLLVFSIVIAVVMNQS